MCEEQGTPGEGVRKSRGGEGDSNTWWPLGEMEDQLVTQETLSNWGWLFLPIIVVSESNNIILLSDCFKIPFKSSSHLLYQQFVCFF